MTTCLERHTPAAPSTPNPNPQKSLSRWPVLLLLCHYKPFTGCPLLSIHKKGFIPFATSCLYDTKQWIAWAGTWNPPAQPGKCPFLLTPSQLLEEQRHRERTHYRITSLWLHCSRFSKLMAYEIEAIKKTHNKTKITTMSIFVVGFSFPRSCLVSWSISLNWCLANFSTQKNGKHSTVMRGIRFASLTALTSTSHTSWISSAIQKERGLVSYFMHFHFPFLAAVRF